MASEPTWPVSRRMASPRSKNSIASTVCAECLATHEDPIGEAVVAVVIGTNHHGLCLAHAIQLALDTRKVVRKDFPAALTH